MKDDAHLIAPKGQISDSQHNLLWFRACTKILDKYVLPEFHSFAIKEINEALNLAEQRKSDRVNEELLMWKLRQKYSKGK